VFLASTDVLEVVLAATVATNQPQVTGAYLDITTATQAGAGPTPFQVLNNSTTIVTAVSAPASGVTRQVNFLDVYNADTGAVTVTVQKNYNSGASRWIYRKATLQAGESLTYAQGKWVKGDPLGQVAVTAGASAYDVPPGVCLPFGGSVLPPGFLWCDHSAVSRTIYPNLFAAIGTTWGAGDGSTTFNVPDGRGRGFIGADPTGVNLPSNKPALGATLGEETHLLTAAESGVPAHTHPPGTGVSFNEQVASGGGAGYYTGTAIGSFGSTGSNAAASAASAHNNIQPGFAGNWMIKT
jgi:microcystin-dependent protein